MTIFHVLKYYKPFETFTQEDMKSLPEDVFIAFADFVHQCNSYNWYTDEVRNKALKEILLAYEDPD